MNYYTYHSDYLEPIFRPAVLRRLARKIAHIIKNTFPHVDAIACRGISGAALAWPLSIMTQIPVVHVRKENEVTHGKHIEGPNKPINTYIIVDDCITTGRTCHKIMEAIKGADCLAILCYNCSIERPDWQRMFPSTRIIIVQRYENKKT